MQKIPIGLVECRSFPMTEFRVIDGGDEGPTRIIGHAAVYNQLSDDLGGFREKVAPGCFGDLASLDVRCLWNHDANYVFGRSKSGTLSLAEDESGLTYEALPPDTQWARDCMVTLARGDVDQSSFQFQTLDARWEGDTRILVKAELYDVSPVTFPAYPQTDSQVRSALAEILGIEPTNDQLRTALGQLTHDQSPDQSQEDTSGDDDGEARQVLAMLRRRLETAEAYIL